MSRSLARFCHSRTIYVIPAKAGIQFFKHVMDFSLRGMTGCGTLSEIAHFKFTFIKYHEFY
jgi:hypothetical protein